MESRPGTLIAIEGIDGSGKTIQIRLLKEKLEREGYEVETFDFPQYNEPGSFFVRQYLSGVYGRADQVTPYNAALFFALDRYEAAASMRRALANGKVVLANRYTGSNMAHQGAKFVNPEERRGYFIWADNLEFQLLGIPRPDKTIVLRVPVDTAQQLVEQRGRTAHTANQLDVHEADPSHTRRAAEVYEDLCQLFPKDFQRIDCMRDNQLLSTEAIHDIIRTTIEPLLPIREQTAPEPASAVTPQASAAPAAAPLPRTTTISKVSRVLVSELRKLGIVDHEIIQPHKTPDYYTPEGLTEQIEQQYWDALDRIIIIFNELSKATAHHLQQIMGLSKEKASLRALQAAQAILPLATLTTAVLNVDEAEFKQIVLRLHTSELPEVQQFVQKVTGQILPKNSATILVQMGQEFLPNTHAPTSPTPQLVSYAPRNELDLVPDILYEYSNLPLQSIKEAVSTWPIARKQDAFMAFAQTGISLESTNNVLDAVHYTFDLLADQTLQNSLLAAGAIVETQQLTPRHGYEIPTDIEDAGLSEKFEEAVDHSLSLYNALQAGSYFEVANYSILLCHKQRCMVTLSLRQLLALQSKPVGKLLATSIQEVHPLLASSLASN